MFLNSNVEAAHKAVEWQQKIILKADNLEKKMIFLCFSKANILK